ncbi:diaminopimelate epimerase [Flavobacteriaceae bacterium UJ101]|nr:diaminopimelate epimerase [Flavobacteriaceae bacterium UJ101]
MKFSIYKYQGTGNDFVIIDDRKKNFPVDKKLIENLCNRRFGIGADGLMLLQDDEKSDFHMYYFNSDGNESTMCGNGGRSLVRFAHDLNVISNKTSFNAIDGLHDATIFPDKIALGMTQVEKIEEFEDHYFLNTGSPHHVEFVKNVETFDVFNKGKQIRNGAPYFKEGTNVNFIEKIAEDTLFVRTYERGVEDETYSCGTGVTAAAIAAYRKGITNNHVHIKTLGGNLEVSFNEKDTGIIADIQLIGPAKFVFKGEIDTDDFNF